MITIRWTHLAVILVLIMGLFIGSRIQFTPNLALAQQSANNPNTAVALQIFNRDIYIVKGNMLYIFQTRPHPLRKDQKTIRLLGKTEIEKE